MTLVLLYLSLWLVWKILRNPINLFKNKDKQKEATTGLSSSHREGFLSSWLVVVIP